MAPGLGDRLKKIAKTVGDADRVLQNTEAVLQGRRPLSSITGQSPPGSAPPGTSGAQAPSAANLRCNYCSGLVTRGASKCPNCNAPM